MIVRYLYKHEIIEK